HLGLQLGPYLLRGYDCPNSFFRLLIILNTPVRWKSKSVPADSNIRSKIIPPCPALWFFAWITTSSVCMNTWTSLKFVPWQSTCCHERPRQHQTDTRSDSRRPARRCTALRCASLLHPASGERCALLYRAIFGGRRHGA